MGLALLYSAYHINQLQTQIADLHVQGEQYQEALSYMRQIETKAGEVANSARGTAVEEPGLELESLADEALTKLTGER